MIIGYQIEDKHGRNWSDNLDRSDNPRTVLSEQSAIVELKKINNVTALAYGGAYLTYQMLI